MKILLKKTDSGFELETEWGMPVGPRLARGKPLPISKGIFALNEEAEAKMAQESLQKYIDEHHVIEKKTSKKSQKKKFDYQM